MKHLPCRDVAVLGVAVTCLQLFVQNNWVGPPMDKDPVSLLPEGYRQDDKLVSTADKSHVTKFVVTWY